MKKLLTACLLTTVLCGAAFAETILSEGFEGNVFPSDWTQNSVLLKQTYAYSGTNSAQFSANSDWLISPPLTNAQTLTAWAYATSLNPSLGIETSTNSTGPWTPAGAFSFSVEDDWVEQNITLSSDEVLYVRFQKSGSGSVYIDDVLVDDEVAGNLAPVLASIGDKAVVVSNELSFTVSAADINGDDIVLSATSLPDSAVFNTVTNAAAVANTFTWTDAAPIGSYSVTFFADDGTTNVSETVNITVTEAPVLPESVTFDFADDAVLYDALDNQTGPITYTNNGLVATFETGNGEMNRTSSGFGINSDVTGDDTDGFDTNEWIDITFEIPVVLTNIAVGSWNNGEDQAVIYVNSVSNGVITTDGNTSFELIVPASQTLRIAATNGVLNNGWSLESITLRTNTNAPPVPNTLPVLYPAGDQLVVVGSPVSFSVSAADADNDEIVLSANGRPADASFNTVTNAGAVTNTFSWASATPAGEYNITFTADDGTTNVSQTVTITVIEKPLMMISEIADPDGTGAGGYLARFVEIYNAGTNTIDLADWTLSRQNNGETWTDLALTGSIAPTETYVAARSADFALAYGFEPDATNTVADGNGFDAYALYFGGDHTSGTLIDIFGELDTNGENTVWNYEDARARRNASVSEPNTTWTASEWTITSSAATNMLSPGTHGAAPELILPLIPPGSLALGTDLSWVVTATNGVNTNDVITLSAIVLPDGAAFPAVEGTGTVSSTLSWTLTNSGTYKVTFLAEGTDDLDSDVLYIYVAAPEQPEQPVINLTVPTGGPITIAWPTSAGSAFNVLTNSNLLNTNGWGNASLTPFLNSDSYKVTNAIGSDPTLFYKLESQ